jgi:glyoxylase-like metal-dependent hydrolase (beta-lactamase superfamily II)
VSAPQTAIPGVHRIELPLPFELERINLYVVALDRGCLLIDCGMDTPQSFAALEAGLREIGIGWRDLRMVLLTHMHPDHIGLSRRLRELTGAEFLMHEAEAEHLDSLEDEGRRLPYLHAAYTLGGVPPDIQARMDDAFSFLRQSLHVARPDRLLIGGERLPSAIGPLTVLLTPGHSPGHVCLYAEESKALFSGDHILNQITPNIAWHPEGDALGDYLASLERIGELEIDRIFPAHGEPFNGHRQWIEETTAHHGERCAQILAAAAGGARTAHEMVGHLWTRRLDPIHHHFAVFEVLAHLEYMRRRGRVGATESGGVMEWGAIRP